MDIDKLKQKEDKKELDDLLRVKLKTIAKYKFYNFSIIYNEVTEEINTKIKNKKQDFINEFIEYFYKKDFSVETKSNMYTAKYKGLYIILINEDNNMFSLKIPSEKIFYKIQIKEENIFSNMIYCKDILRYKSEDLNTNNYKKIIENIDEIQELEELIKIIQKNINHYKRTLDYFEMIKYIYSIYKSSYVECTTFKALFEIYISENSL
ncbi:hypothetical protein [Clostridium ganghwense]|uniref:IDEAL domain-containing protein n=1 Tax=Clostridium ganghwense TaxID=312089 RepID=A0ABT4CQW5_9CLOT|nr:hypothetical protein [Clostridium ganghwense]MCY6370471.1 hypothetical protein [Clostridium ganghwense]